MKPTVQMKIAAEEWAVKTYGSTLGKEIAEGCYNAMMGISVVDTFAAGELVRLQVKQGDKFFIMFKDQLPQEAIFRIKEIWRQYIGDDKADILVLTNGAALGVFNVDEAKRKDDPREFGSGQ